MICEAFLNCEPYLGFRKKIRIKLQTNVSETCERGGAAIIRVDCSKYYPREFMGTIKRWYKE